MITFKLIGALVVLSVGGVCAFCSVRYERRRPRVLDGWIDMIQHIRSQIDCYLTPIPEIIADVLPSHLPSDLFALLDACRLYLDGDTLRVLERFARDLGGSYREEQLRHCDFCLAELRRKREKLSSELPLRQRLSVTLCACVSIGTAILLW